MAVQPPHFRHWPSGLPHTLDYPDVPVPAILSGSARRYGDLVAFHYRGHEITYAGLWRRACQFAHALHARGIGPGSVVGLHMPNCPQYPVAYYGSLLAGATVSPIDPLLPPESLAGQLADSEAAAVVTYGRGAAAIAAVVLKTRLQKVIITDRAQAVDLSARVDTSAFGAAGVDFARMFDARLGAPPRVGVVPNRDLAHIAYTGGTTGQPKGVMLTHRNVVAAVVQFTGWLRGSLPALDDAGGLFVEQLGNPEDYPVRLGRRTLIAATPWSRALGVIGYLNLPVLQGATVIIHDRFDSAAYLADCERFGVSTIGGAPALFAALLACPDIVTRDLSAVRVITSGGARLSPELYAALQERLPDATICEGYGLTEATMGVTSNPAAHRTGLHKPGTVGMPIFDTEVKIIPASRREGARPAREGEQTGEICVRGPQIMAGYHNRPEETAAVLSEDGWLRTGDIGTLDEDGYLTIVDRITDTLTYKGYHVYPRELEAILFQHPAVANVAVIGDPDPAVGDLATAFVIIAPGERATAQELLSYVAKRVPPYKRLRRVNFVLRIPVSPTGEVIKHELRRQQIVTVANSGPPAPRKPPEAAPRTPGDPPSPRRS